MTPDERARQAVLSYWHIGNTFSLNECITRVIRQAEQDAYSRVLSIISEHQEHDTFAHLDELEDEIKQAMTDP
jgi:hypothetical protein